MKKVKILILLLFFSSVLWAMDSNISFSQNQGKITTVFVIKENNFKTMLSFSTDQEGNIQIKAPMSFALNLNESIRFGELKPDGVLLQSLEVKDTSGSVLGYREQRFKDVNTPSYDSKYYGVVIPFRNLELFAFDKTRKSFGFDFGNRNAFAVFLMDDSTIINEKPQEYSVDWQQLSGTSKSISLLFGANSSFRKNRNYLNSQIFLRIIKDQLAKTDVSMGLDISARLNYSLLSYRKRLGNFGEINKFTLKNNNINFTYEDEISVKPIFFGEYQKKTTKLALSGTFRGLTVKRQIKYLFSERGKRTISDDYSLKYQKENFSLEFQKDQLEFKTESSKLLLGRNNSELEYFWEFDLSEKLYGKLRVSSNRELGLSLHYSD